MAAATASGRNSNDGSQTSAVLLRMPLLYPRQCRALTNTRAKMRSRPSLRGPTAGKQSVSWSRRENIGGIQRLVLRLHRIQIALPWLTPAVTSRMRMRPSGLPLPMCSSRTVSRTPNRLLCSPLRHFSFVMWLADSQPPGSKEMREELRGRNLSFSEIAKLVGENWQSLSPTEKEPFESHAQAMKEKYLKEIAEYKKTPEYRQYQAYLREFKAKHGCPSQGAPLSVSCTVVIVLTTWLVCWRPSQKKTLQKESSLSRGARAVPALVPLRLGGLAGAEVARTAVEGASSLPAARKSTLPFRRAGPSIRLWRRLRP